MTTTKEKPAKQKAADATKYIVAGYINGTQYSEERETDVLSFTSSGTQGIIDCTPEVAAHTRGQDCYNLGTTYGLQTASGLEFLIRTNKEGTKVINLYTYPGVYLADANLATPAYVINETTAKTLLVCNRHFNGDMDFFIAPSRLIRRGLRAVVKAIASRGTLKIGDKIEVGSESVIVKACHGTEWQFYLTQSAPKK
ncbi:MAG: hypothetical protein RR382_00100 [Tannerellaceae bacterium]